MTKPYRSLVDECLETECPAGHWCLLKEIVLAGRILDPRLLVQMKCIEIHAHNMGKRLGRHVRLDEAAQEWASAEYAALFAEVYSLDPDQPVVDMYRKITHEQLK